jgi:hypothetical protein
MSIEDADRHYLRGLRSLEIQLDNFIEEAPEDISRKWLEEAQTKIRHSREMLENTSFVGFE